MARRKCSKTLCFFLNKFFSPSSPTNTGKPFWKPINVDEDPLSTITIFHINIQCLSNKVNLLELFCQRYGPNILCLNEHWLCKDQLDNTIISDYSIISHFSRSEQAYGGSVVFLKNIL